MSTDIKPKPDRIPVPIKRLLITHTNPHGVQLPDGVDGRSTKMVHNLSSGEEGGIKTVIEHLPWARVFRVTRHNKVTRTGKDGTTDEVRYEPRGEPFRIPDSWAVSIAAEDV